MATRLSDLDGRNMPDLSRWRVYVNDDNVVTCNAGCEDPDFLDWVDRRVEFGHVMMALWGHIIDHHPEEGMTADNEIEPWTTPALCGHPECSYACSRERR